MTRKRPAHAGVNCGLIFNFPGLVSFYNRIFLNLPRFNIVVLPHLACITRSRMETKK